MENFMNVYFVFTVFLMVISSIFIGVLMIGSRKKRGVFLGCILDKLSFLILEVISIFLPFSFLLMIIIIFINNTEGWTIDNKLIFIGLIFTLFNILFQNRPFFNKKVSVVIEEKKIKITNKSNYNIQIPQIKLQNELIVFNNSTNNNNIEIDNFVIKNIPEGKIYISNGSFIELEYEKIKEEIKTINITIYCTYKYKIMYSQIKSSLLI